MLLLPVIIVAGCTPPPLAGEGGAEPLPEAARFHHVHLNIVDRDSTLAYYEHFFGANRIRYRDRADALFTERSFLLLTEVTEPPRENAGTSLWHIGWAGVHGPTEFEWRSAAGIGVQTPLSELGSNHYMYFWGPDRELVEVYTGSRNHRFEHVHLLASDLDASLAWFEEQLGLRATGPTRRLSGTEMRLNTIRVDNVNIILFEVPGPGEEPAYLLPEAIGPDFEPTEGRAIDHIAFSYPDIEPVRERLRAAGVPVVRELRTEEEYGFPSFFIRGPDGVLIEIVEERGIPDGIWP